MLAPSFYETLRYPALLRYFSQISEIPRETYHEEAIADFLCDFAKARNLEYVRDAYQNVLIKKPASAGFTQAPPILLQGHTDMVCEKESGVTHDFAADPLDLYVEDGWLRARGTTLGADDGVAVAIMLYLLDGGAPEHPALECLFTASEEMGMDGAENFDYSLLSARHMVNLDSPDEDLIIAGCAGGLHSHLVLSAPLLPTEGTCVRVVMGGLAGGHSGEDIHKGRANALKLMGAFLSQAAKKTELHLISFRSGRRENVIPRDAEALVAVSDVQAFEHPLHTQAAAILRRLSAEDHAFSISARRIEAADAPFMLSLDDTARVLGLIEAVPCGILAKNSLGGVEYSRNLGVIETQDVDGERRFLYTALTRSSRNDQLDANADELNAIVAKFGATATHTGRYPGWDYAEHSEIRERYVAAYRAVHGCDPTVTVIHAGLECGNIAQKCPYMDMISVGPRVLDLHSPDERLNLSSLDQFFDVMKHLLASKA